MLVGLFEISFKFSNMCTNCFHLDLCNISPHSLLWGSNQNVELFLLYIPPAVFLAPTKAFLSPWLLNSFWRLRCPITSQGDGLGHPPARQRHHGQVPAQRPVREGRRAEALGPPQDDLWDAQEEGGGAGLGTNGAEIIIVILRCFNGRVPYIIF